MSAGGTSDAYVMAAIVPAIRLLVVCVMSVRLVQMSIPARNWGCLTML